MLFLAMETMGLNFPKQEALHAQSVRALLGLNHLYATYPKQFELFTGKES
jgi:hypothetical protein